MRRQNHFRGPASTSGRAALRAVQAGFLRQLPRIPASASQLT